MNHVISKLNKCSHIMHRSKHFLDKKFLTLIFNAIGLVYINYYAIILSTISQTDFKAIEMKYRQCGAVIHNCFINSLDNFNWPNLQKIINIINSIYIFKILRLNYAYTLKPLLSYNSINKSYNLRNSNNLQVDRFNKSYGKKCFSHWDRKLWNELLNEAKTCTSINTFKDILKA